MIHPPPNPREEGGVLRVRTCARASVCVCVCAVMAEEVER